MTALVATVLSVAVALGAPREAIATPALALDWQAPATCPAEADVRARIDALLAQRRPRASTAPPVAARVVIADAPGGAWRVLVETRDGDAVGERSVEVASCERATEFAVLVVALAVAPPTGGAVPRTEPSTATTARATRLAPEPTPAIARPQAAERPRAAVRLSTALDVGTFPAPAFGLALAGGVLLGIVRFDALASLLPPQRVVLTGTTIGADFWLLAAGLRTCLTPLRTDVELGVCTAFEFGYLEASGRGVRDARPVGNPWIATTLTAALAWRPTRLVALVAEVGPAVTLLGGTFVLETVNPDRPIHTTSPVLLRAQIGVELRF